jgi:hypothetical protein
MYGPSSFFSSEALIVGEDVLLKQLYNGSIKFAGFVLQLNGMVCCDIDMGFICRQEDFPKETSQL